MRTSKFPANYQNLEDIREFVGGIARQAEFSEKEVYAIQLATDEASTNIIEHAYGVDSQGEIEIRCWSENGDFVVILHDRGKSFDPSSVPEPNVNADLSERRIGGLGMYLMRKLMDEVTYEASAEKGNVLTMIKRKGSNP